MGSAIGGALGNTIGLRPTIGLAVLATLLAVTWLLRSPISGLREAPMSGPGAQ